jgi:hypothetical protein
MPYTDLAIVVLVGVAARAARSLPMRAHAAAQPRSAFACLGWSTLESGLLGFIAAAFAHPGIDGALRMRAIDMGIALYLSASNLSAADLGGLGYHPQSQHVLFYVLVCTALSNEAATLGRHFAQVPGIVP